MAGATEVTFSIKIDPILNVQKLNAILNELSRSLGDLGKDIKPIDEAKLTAALKKIDDEAKKTGQDVKGAFDKGNEGAGQFTKSVDTVKSKLKEVGDISSKAFNFTMLSQSLGAAGQSIQSLSNQFVELDKGLRNVGTLGVSNWQDFSGLMETYIAKGRSAEEVTKSLYDAISAGTVSSKGGIGDVAGATAFLESSSKLAKAGLVDMSVTTDALTTLLNSYGASAQEAGKYSDYLFGAVKVGKTTVAQLAPALFNVVPTAKSAGIAFDQVAAALATITKAGVPTSVATTQLRQMIVEMMKPTGQLALIMQKLGISVESIKAEGLQKTMLRLNEEMTKTGKVANTVFSSVEAANAFNALQLTDATGAKTALQDLEFIQTQAIGSVDKAYALAADSIESKSKSLFGKVQLALTKTFSAISPSLISIMNVMPQITTTLTAFAAIKLLNPIEGISKLASGLMVMKSNVMAFVPTLINGFKQAATSLATMQFSGLGGFLTGLKSIGTTLLTTLIPSATGATTAFSAMWAAATGPVGLIVGGIAAVTGALFGMHALFTSLRAKSAEEQLKEVDTWSKANQKKLQLANDQVKMEQDKQSKLANLQKEYKDLNTAVVSNDFVSDEQKNYVLSRQKEILIEINKQYPNLIKNGDDYATVMNKIAAAQQQQEQALTQKKAVAFDMEVAQVKIDTKKASLEAQKAGEDITKVMKESTQGWMDKAFEWVTGTSPLEQSVINQMNQYKQAIYKATNENDLKQALLNYQTAIWTDPAFQGVPEETKLKMSQSIEDMGVKQGEAMKKAMEMVKLQGGNIEDYLPKVPKESAGWLADLIPLFQPVIDGFNSVWQAISPVIDVIKGLAIVVGDFIADLIKWIGNAIWSSIISIFNTIFGILKGITTYIVSKVISAWNGLIGAFQSVGAWVGNLANKFSVLGMVLNTIKGTIDSVWNGIKNVIAWAQKAWNWLASVGKAGTTDKTAPLKKDYVSDDDINKAKQYDKLQQERIKNNNTEQKQTSSQYQAMKQQLLEMQEKWASMGYFDQQQFRVAFRKNLRQATALTEEQRKELNDLFASLKPTGNGTPTKETQEKDYDDWKKLEEELAKRRAEVIRKNMQDETLVELQALKDKYNEKIKSYENDISKYENELNKTKSEKEKESLQKSIQLTKELMKVEGDEYDANLQALYDKITDKRIKAINDLTKSEVTALKDRKETLKNYIETGMDVDISMLQELQQIEQQIVIKNSEQQIASIIQQSDGYKELTKQIVQYELALKQMDEETKQGKTIDAAKQSELQKQLAAAQTQLNDFIKTQREANEQIKLIQQTSDAQLLAMKKQDELEFREWQIKLVNDALQQEFELSRLNADKEYQDKLKKSRGFISEEIDAYVNYQNKLAEIELKRIEKTQPYYSQFTNFFDNFANAAADLKITFDDSKNNENITKYEEQKKALQSQLKQQTIAYTDYVNQMNELDKQRKEQVVNTNNEIIKAINDALKTAFQQTIDATKTSLQATIKEYKNYNNSIRAIKEQEANLEKNTQVNTLEDAINLYNQLTDLSQKRAAMEQKQQEIMRQAFMDTGVIVGATFAKMVADGKSATKALVLSMLAGVKAMIPIFIVQILGRELAEKSLPGIITAGILTGLLTAALSAAEAAVGRMAFKRGVVNLQGGGTETSDSIPARLSRGESVVPAAATRQNIKELTYLLTNNKKIINYYKEQEPEALKQAYYEIATAKDFLKFAPVMNLILEERKIDNNEIRILKSELQTMNQKLDLLTSINQNIERGNYSRKTNTSVDLNLEINDKELIQRVKRQDLMSVRRS